MNQDQKELIESLLDSEVYPALLDQMDKLVYEGFEKPVLQCSIGLDNEKELIHRKLKAEGARGFLIALMRSHSAMKAKRK